MYLRAVHAEFDIPALRRFIRDNPLGILITAFKSADSPTIQCTHIPWVLDVTDNDSPDELGSLRGHLARNNPHSKSMSAAVREHSDSNGFLEQEVSVLFNGPAHSYLTPKFYTKTKPETGKVVPTWNYSAVQATGIARIFWDTRNHETDSYLQKQIEDLTNHMEHAIIDLNQSGKETPWEVADAPTPFINILKKSIIGIEIDIKRLEGKYKMSQEMDEEDQEGIVHGFHSLGTDNGHKIALTVEERGRIQKQQKAKKQNEEAQSAR